jgi:hypothetical protein
VALAVVVGLVGAGLYYGVLSDEITVLTPGVPREVSANPGNASATVRWSAPEAGDGPVSSYRVVSHPDGHSRTVDGSTFTATVGGLTNGTAYTFTVVAENSRGAGEESAHSAPVTPATVPSAPSQVHAEPGNGEITLIWGAPDSDGGDAITGYTVTLEPGGGRSRTGTDTRSATFSGLTNGGSYTLTAAALNQVGTGESSPATPPTVPATTPATPAGVTAIPGNGEATVSWLAPNTDGDSAVTGYVVMANPGGATTTVGGAARFANVTGLDNGVAYTFTVAATNDRGTGEPSAPTAVVVPSVDPSLGAA